ncbi:MAG: hypothetical protein HYT87_02240 [Nitrospirae bacterium]|nr:hypothetical protein [Nitrospirota bacterium]
MKCFDLKPRGAAFLALMLLAGACESKDSDKTTTQLKSASQEAQGPKSDLMFSGVVRDNLTGKPISGATVQVNVVTALPSRAPTRGESPALAPLAQTPSSCSPMRVLPSGVRRTHIRREVKTYEVLTGPSGEYVVPEIDLPAGTDAALNIFAPGFAPINKNLSREELKSGKSHATEVALQPYTHSEKVDEKKEVRTPDGAFHLQLSDNIKCSPKCDIPADPAFATGAKSIAVDVSVSDPSQDTALLPGQFDVKLITICHRPPGNASVLKTTQVTASALDAHIHHGDTEGACPGDEKGEKEAKAEDSLQLQPIAQAHFEVRTDTNVAVTQAVTKENPASVVLAVPDSLQEKMLKEYDEGERSAMAFHYNAATGEFIQEEKDARLIVVEEKKGKEKKRKVFIEAQVTHACTTLVATPEPTVPLQGKVVDDEGKPVEDAWVRAEGLTTNTVNHARTDENGEYVVRVPEDDMVKVTTGRTKQETQPATSETPVLVDTSKPIEDGEAFKVPEIEVADPVTIEGRVVDQNGNPLTGSVVTSDGTSAPIEPDGTFSVPASPTTDTVRIVTEVGGKEVSTVVPVEPTTGGVTEDLGEVTIPEPTVITGKVTEGDTGKPLSDAVVEANGNAVKTDPNGNYTLVIPKTDEVVDLVIEGVTESGLPISQEVQVDTKGATQTQAPTENIKTEEQVLVGRVVDVEGNGVPGAIVQVEGGQALTTDSEGRFKGEVLHQDDLELEAVTRDGASRSESTLEKTVHSESAKETVEVEFQVDGRPAFVQGIVTKGTGDPAFGEPSKAKAPSRAAAKKSTGIPLAGVSVVSSLGGSTETDANGRYKISVAKDSELTLVFALGSVKEEVGFTTGEKGSVTHLDVQLNVEDAPPQVESVSTDAPAAKPGGNLEIKIVVADDKSGAQFEVDESVAGKVANPEGTVPSDGVIKLEWTAPTEPGWYEIPVTITDSSGNETDVTPTVEVRTENLPPDIAAVDPSTLAPIPGEQVQVSVSASDPDADALTHKWTLKDSDGTDYTALLTNPTTDTVTFVTPSIPDGTELELTVEVTDPKGNKDKQTVDLDVGQGEGRPPEAQALVPETTLAAEPPKAVASATQPLELKSNNPKATFECSLDGGPAKPCSSKPTLAELAEGKPLADGDHTITVQAVSPTGVKDPKPLTVTVDLDTQPPKLKFDPSIPAQKTTKGVSLPITEVEEDVEYECQLDNGEYQPCSPPFSFVDLKDGDHSCKVKAADPAGNKTDPVEVKFTVDTVPPVFGGVSSATPAAAGKADLAWTAGTDNVSAQNEIVYQICQTTTSFGCCGSSFTPTYTSSAGATSYSVTGLSGASTFYFVVRAKDKAGNVDASQIEKAAVFSGIQAPRRP